MNDHTKRLQIIGAGFAGLLAANILRRFNPLVIEAQPSLPANHSALLRFRSPSFSDAVGIPFRKVLVRKAIWTGTEVTDRCTIPLANTYSARVTGGEYMARSIWNLEPEHRWIAPDNLAQIMAQGIEIGFNNKGNIGGWGPAPVISTIPMPVAMAMVGGNLEDGAKFRHNPIWTLKVNIKGCSLFQTIYNADPKNCWEWYRATIHGGELTVECHIRPPLPAKMIETILTQIFRISTGAGAYDLKEQKFGKMLPVADSIRRSFIVRLTTECNVFSLGRFATWRPIILDDVVQDVKRIEAMIEQGSYFTRLSAVK